MPVRFEWDEEKAKANLKKHKVDFDEASTVFSDPLAHIFDDEEHSTEDEKREIIIGHSEHNRLLLVAFVERIIDLIRIISARRATKKERKQYEEHANLQSPP
ncbi:MAG: BrnT family toxin [Chloroflexi bacterium]|nr:BrnT family toxin [Chloroflexota bacterium]